MLQNPNFLGVDPLNLPLHGIQIGGSLREEVSAEFKSLLSRVSENLIQSLPGASNRTTNEGVNIHLVSRFSYSMIKDIIHPDVHMTSPLPTSEQKSHQFEHLASELKKLMIQESSELAKDKSVVKGISPFLPKYGHIARNADEANSLFFHPAKGKGDIAIVWDAKKVLARTSYTLNDSLEGGDVFPLSNFTPLEQNSDVLKKAEFQIWGNVDLSDAKEIWVDAKDSEGKLGHLEDVASFYGISLFKLEKDSECNSDKPTSGHAPCTHVKKTQVYPHPQDGKPEDVKSAA